MIGRGKKIARDSDFNLLFFFVLCLLQHGYIRNILRPYQLVLALGVSLMFLSLVGFLGTACPSRRIGKEMLFGYFSTVLVFVCVLMWGAVMCFQYVVCPFYSLSSPHIRSEK